MNGRLGRPYRFFYSAKNYATGLSNIIAQVKKPNGSFHGNYTLLEFTGGLFDGSYYFDIPSTQNDPEGEYVIAILEQTSLHKTTQKVTLDLNTSDGGAEIQDPDLFGRIYSESITGKIINNGSLVAHVNNDSLSAKLSEDIIVGLIENTPIKYSIREEYLIGKLSECK